MDWAYLGLQSANVNRLNRHVIVVLHPLSLPLLPDKEKSLDWCECTVFPPRIPLLG